MVPPIVVGQDVSITRTGNQQTYVFFKAGVQTVVIRPGFIGSVEEFGMLIPFPAVPELRKVPDNVFPHIAAAVDPPEVVVDLRLRFRALADAPAAPPGGARGGLAVRSRSVRVIKEEAVGMYEVAVLEAGSAAALQKWMQAHQYRYPQGMDQATNDYIESGWCFVAVKTRVGNKQAVEARPGIRKVNSRLPQGALFDGHVQAMGFRFRVKDLVVPMRLSTFNEGDLHNIVYILTDRPQRIDAIPSKFVVRQVSGEQLYKNITELLPLRIIGGSLSDLRPFHQRTLPQQRNPVPRNGTARDLFAGDLLAVESGQLSHPHEEDEKMLLRIGERLGLRGPAYDRLQEQETQKSREDVVKRALPSLKTMTLTVVDGEFPREILANQNLTFSDYTMADARNSSSVYDANTKSARKKREGRLYNGPLPPAKPSGAGQIPAPSPSRKTSMVTPLGKPFTDHNNSRRPFQTATPWWAVLLAGLGCGLVWKSGQQTSQKRVLTGLLVLIAASYCVLGQVAAQDADDTDKILALIDQLEDPKRASDAADALIALGEKAVPHLLGEAAEGQAMTVRGWSIVCLAEIGGKQADARFVQLHDDPQQPQLVRNWAAAARVHIANSNSELVALSTLTQKFPSLVRPLSKKLVQRLESRDEKVSTEALLQLSINMPQLRSALAPTIIAEGGAALIRVMLHDKTVSLRRQAAAYLGTLASQSDEKLVSEIVKAYRFDPQAKQTPWTGGPLFVPSLNWKPQSAKQLVGHLVAWYVWCDLHDQKQQQSAIHNNLRSIRLARVAGYERPGFRQANTEAWLASWGKVVGRAGIESLLKQQNVHEQPRFQTVMEKLK